MDLRFIAVLMILMAILDFLGRRARKRAGVEQSEDGDSLDGAGVLKALTGEQPKRPEARAAAIPPAGVGRDQAVPAVLQRAAVVAPRAGGVPVAAPPVAMREPWVLELRDRAPREIHVRSRDPRPLEELPSPHETRSAEEVAVGAVSPRAKPRQHPPPPARRSRSTDVGKRLGLGSADDLRRLVVAREVLGPPLAMRDK